MKIYSPAIISAKGKLYVGHGSNLVWCDILGRRYRQKGEKVEYLFPSWNHQGKRLEGLVNPEEQAKVAEPDLLEKLNLFGLDSYRPYRDSDPDSRKNSQKYFRRLQETGFIKKSENQYTLDISKTIQGTNFIEDLKKINFMPEDVRKKLLDLVNNVNGLYPLSKPRSFATDILGESSINPEKINPIFDLAVSPALFSEDNMDYSIDGSRTFFHGTFIPLVIWSSLFNKPFSRNICIHGYVTGECKPEVEDFYNEITPGVIPQDILRYCLVQCTYSFEDTKLNPDRVLKARKLFHKISNISEYILKYKGVQKTEEKEDDELGEMIDQMKHYRALSLFETKMFSMSKKIFHEELSDADATNFLRSINTMAPFFPQTIREIKERVSERNHYE